MVRREMYCEGGLRLRYGVGLKDNFGSIYKASSIIFWDLKRACDGTDEWMEKFQGFLGGGCEIESLNVGGTYHNMFISGSWGLHGRRRSGFASHMNI